MEVGPAANDSFHCINPYAARAGRKALERKELEKHLKQSRPSGCFDRKSTVH